MRATGPAEASQRRKAVRGRVTVPVEAEYGSIELKGETVDLSEAGLRAEFEGLGAPPEAGAKLDLSVQLEDGGIKTKAEVVRTQARGARWVMSIRFVNIQEKDQDRVRRRVFQALREERAKQGRRRPAGPARVVSAGSRPDRGRKRGVTSPPPRLPDALTALRDQLAAAPLGLATPDRDAARRAARAVADQIDDYLLPRLRDLDAPLLTVVGGSTGAGKSTLVNSLVGAPVTTAGVLRPTTRAPVLVCARADVAAFSGDRVLPGLPRVTGSAGGPGTVQLVVRDDLPAGPRAAGRPGRRLGGGVQPRARRPAAGGRGPLGLRHDGGPLRRRRPLGPAPDGAGARHRARRRARPGAARGRGARWPPTSPGCSQRAGLAGARLFVIEERPLADGRLPEDQVRPAARAGCTRSPPTRRRGPPWSGRP